MSSPVLTYRPARVYVATVRPRRRVPRSPLWWLRKPTFLNGVSSIIEVSGYEPWLDTRRFWPTRDGEMLRRDLDAVGQDLRTVAVRLVDSEQGRLFDPDALVAK